MPTVAVGNTSGQANDIAVDVGAGAAGLITQRVLIATDQTAVKVDGSAVTQPVSGTVTATGPVTDTQLRATAVPVSGTVAVSGTSAVSAASLPLPTGAATAAKQPALGTAGTASTDVLTVQGIASGTALKTDSSATTQPVSGTVAVSGTVPVSGPATDTQLRATPLPVSGTVAVSGTSAVSIATAPVLVAGAAIIGKVGIDQTTPGTTNLVALAAGTNAVGKLAANAGVNIGDIITQPRGATPALTNVASSATTVALLASNAGRKGMAVYNDSTAILYLKLGATASATSFTVAMAANSYYEMPEAWVYTGTIDGIWASATGSARLTELT